MKFADLQPSLAGWLADASDAHSLTPALIAADPDLAPRVVSCEPKKLRLTDRDGTCRGTYLLVLSTADGGLESVQVGGVVRAPAHRTPGAHRTGTFGTPEWSVRLESLGVELSTLPVESGLEYFGELADPATAPARITAVLQTGPRAADEIVVRSAAPTVMRHKRGSRCTFRYDVEIESAAPSAAPFPATIIAKTYAGDKGVIADRSMRALWASTFRSSPTVRIAEPLGYDPERRILLQGPVPESRTLKAALVGWFAGTEPDGWDRLLADVHRTGVGLAEMHSCGAAGGDEVGIDEELEEIRDRAARVRAVFPTEGLMLDQIVAVVSSVVGASEPEPAVGSHRSFRPAQVLLSGEVMSFIDFDGFCQAEPAMDVAMFCSMIRAISLNKGVEDKASLATMADTTRAARLADGERLCAAFLAGYRTVRPINAARVVAWETAHIGSLVVASWTKLKLSRLPNTLYLFDDQLERNGAVVTGP